MVLDCLLSYMEANAYGLKKGFVRFAEKEDLEPTPCRYDNLTIDGFHTLNIFEPYWAPNVPPTHCEATPL